MIAGRYVLLCDGGYVTSFDTLFEVVCALNPEDFKFPWSLEDSWNPTLELLDVFEDALNEYTRETTPEVAKAHLLLEKFRSVAVSQHQEV